MKTTRRHLTTRHQVRKTERVGPMPPKVKVKIKFKDKQPHDDGQFRYQPIVKKTSKRMDVVLRRQNRKHIVERSVFCSLPMRLGHGFNDQCSSLLRDEIERWVLSTSKVTHRLSIIFNRLLLFLVSNNRPLPTFNESFFNGLALHGMKETTKQSKNEFSSLINDFCDNEFNTDENQYPKIERQRGDCQAIKIASSRYMVNFKNTLHTPFLIRQLKYIKVWSQVNNLDLEKRTLRNIQHQINGWAPMNNVDPVIDKFIREQRVRLGQPKYIDTDWLKSRTTIVIQYYYHILVYYTENEHGNKFRMAPLCQIKCHSLAVDDVVLREILCNIMTMAVKKNIEFPDWIRSKIKEKKMTDDVWKAVFNYDGLRRNRRFSHRIDTDGTKACFHFQTTKKQVSKKNRRKKRKQRERRYKQKETQRVIAIDPGRANLIMAYDTEQEKYYRLTRGYYYRSTGVKSLTRRINKENLQMKGVYESMSKTPTKTIRERDWWEYQMIVTRYYDELWSMNATEKRRREHMRVKRLKEKCLDVFLNKFMVKGEKDPLIAYGAASMNTTGKGELSVPVKYVYEKCKRRYDTEKENEKYSTLMHHKCRMVTTGVKVDDGYTRGLRWCPTCSELVSRDRNACKNIALSFKEEERPNYLCDTYDRGNHKVKQIRGCNHIHQR